jgi:phosphoglycolate phosphatase-like HAD superfamily hydrolase
MSLAEDLRVFCPVHNFFIGIDSDGTVFDSMQIKHVDVFIPVALKTWNIPDAKQFGAVWENINLYSKTRGINRFKALDAALDAVGFDTAPLHAFTESGASLSNAALDAYAQKKPHPFLDEVLSWSRSSDTLFETLTKDLPPFEESVSAIKTLSLQADIMVISSASGAGLAQDWKRAGLSAYTALIAGQEAGGKKEQLSLAASKKYPADKILMIGDAPGDLEAAESIGAAFYPIIPKDENESWQLLRKEACAKFTNGTYRGQYENALIQTFFTRLNIR